jgi:hypothetical protein
MMWDFRTGISGLADSRRVDEIQTQQQEAMK